MSNTIIELPLYGIIVTLIDGESCGTIVSDRHELIEYGIDWVYDAAMNAIESLILAHACAGVDIESPEYIEGLQTTMETIEQITSNS